MTALMRLLKGASDERTASAFGGVDITVYILQIVTNCNGHVLGFA
jgi:hypothetical protein